MKRWIVALLGIAALAHGQEPPKELLSPDHNHSVGIVQTEWPGSSPYTPYVTLEVCAGARVLSKFPTIGYLLEAYWSPDGTYVAVNNRRANSGDYLWVFRLSDGKALKLPDDQPADKPEDDYAGDERGYKRLVEAVHARFQEYTLDDFRKRFTGATGWKSSSELQVKSNLAFSNLEDGVMEVFETYKITGDKLSLIDQHVE